MKLSICEWKKQCPTFRQIGNCMLFCFRKILSKIFIPPMRLWKQVVHKLFIFLCLIYTQKGYSNLNIEFFKFRFELWESPSKDFLSWGQWDIVAINELSELFECHRRQVFRLRFYNIFDRNKIRSQNAEDPLIRGLTNQ